MTYNKLYKIGTRGSLLALTQCTQTKNELEEKSNDRFELVPITTQGDQITDKPLWQIDGKDFFTKELDSALLSKDVDLVVHSYKDLGSVRPEGIELQVITQRKFAHDILLIKEESIKNLKSLNELIVGTSSPRRTQNIKSHLKSFLPNIKDELNITVKNLRGNVNTRIEKLKTSEYDAIVLALAGLERLARKEESKKILANLLDGINFMILPQKYFTSAASQGALAIECHKDVSDELKNTLGLVHDVPTQEEMIREREAFSSYGGGCHLAVGIHVKKIHDFFIHMHNGSHNDKKISKVELENFDYSPLKNKSVYYVYKNFDFLITKKPLDSHLGADNVFVTSPLCFHNLPKQNSSLWASGNHTMSKLIKDGHWVNGSAEGFGHQEILNFKSSKAIELMLKQSTWKVLSHDNAKSTIGDIAPSYTHEINKSVDKELEKQMLESDIIYWSSIIQYRQYTQKYPELKNKLHATGLGKTYTLFQEEGISTIPCIDMSHLKEKTMES